MTDEISYGERLCAACRTSITNEEAGRYDGCCKRCYETKLDRVKDLAARSIDVMEGPGGKVMPGDTRARKLDEEKKRLDWVKDKERKLSP